VTTATTAASVFSRRDIILLGLAGGTTVVAGVLHYVSSSEVLNFVVAGAALAVLASLVGRSVDALGERLGPAATGILQSALGNLPELFVIAFSLKAGLDDVVKSTIVGSILANVLLILGAAFVVGGLKHGKQKFSAEQGRNLGLMLMLAVLVLAIPALTSALHTPAEGHERTLSVFVSVVMLLLFGLSLVATLRRSTSDATGSGSPVARDNDTAEAVRAAESHGEWPLGLAIGMLAAAGVGAAFVSEWFVSALEPAIATLGINQTFAGLVIVAIAGNAVENVVGVQLMARNQADYAIQVVLQSPVQVALTIAPIITLIAPLLGAASFTLVLSPLLIAALVMSAIVAVIVVMDGESTWFEGCALIALYCAIAAAFWWG
jgi:Ca2+:H+ antiporter